MFRYYKLINNFTTRSIDIFNLPDQFRRRRSPTWRRWSCWPSQTETLFRRVDGVGDGSEHVVSPWKMVNEPEKLVGIYQDTDTT